MTPDDWARMEPLLSRIRTLMAGVLAFIILSLVGAMVQRAADMAFLRKSVVDNTDAVRRIEASLRRLEARK